MRCCPARDVQLIEDRTRSLATAKDITVAAQCGDETRLPQSTGTRIVLLCTDFRQVDNRFENEKL